MNVLVIESNQDLATRVVDHLTDIFNDPEVKIVTSGDLIAAASMMAPSGFGPVGLIVCAETVEETGGQGISSNGLNMMQGYRRLGRCTPMIVLTNEVPPLYVVDGIYFVHREEKTLQDQLWPAVKYCLPDLV